VRALPGQGLGGGDVRSLVQRIAEHPAADGRERDRFHVQLLGQLQRLPITVGQQCRLIAQAVLPDRADGVEHMLCRQIEGRCLADLAGRAAHARADLRQGTAGVEQLRAGRAMDRAVHAAAAQQGFVGRIDDRIHRQGRDVALPHFDLHAYRSLLTVTGSIQRNDVPDLHGTGQDI